MFEYVICDRWKIKKLTLSVSAEQGELQSRSLGYAAIDIDNNLDNY